MDRLAKQQACQLFIEQEIEKGLAKGDSTYQIGKEVAKWIEKLFQAKVRPETIEERARRIKIATNVATDPTAGNQKGIEEIQEFKHGGVREGAGRKPKFSFRELDDKKERDKINTAEIKAAIRENEESDINSICDIRHCSCLELFKSGIKPDAVITDPPYEKKYLGVYEELSKAAKDVPLVAVMCGQSYLQEVINRLCAFLDYRWTLAYLTPGGQSVQQWEAKVNTFWKPVLLFGKSTEWIGDVCKSNPNDNDKRFHEWGQSESGMADLVSRLTKPGQLVCDPFLGAGTTAIVSILLGRKFVGCDIYSGSVNISKRRVLNARSKT